jgi:Undecaprenyl-phosphate glucose phosphotransferase
MRLPRRDLASLLSDFLPPCDLACFLLAAYLGTLLYSLLVPAAPVASSVIIDRRNVALIGGMLATFFLYDSHFAADVSRRAAAVLVRSYALRFAIIVAFALVIGATSRLFDTLPPSWVAIWLTTSLVLTSLTRLAVARHMRRLNQRADCRETVAIVGAGPLAERLAEQLGKFNSSRVTLLGIFDDAPAGSVGNSPRCVGCIDELIELGRHRSIDWIVLATPVDDEVRLQALMHRLSELPSTLGLCSPDIGHRYPGETIDFTNSAMPVVLLADRPIKRWDAVLKGAVDALLARIAIILLLPVMALIALAIRLESPGPIIFKQRRHGINNAEFDIFKFRTMRWSADSSGAGLQQTTRGDSRVSPLGHLLRSSSLDELPQLFNVLKGEMSLVGPRPHAIDMRTEDRLGSEITAKYPHRHRVKPGMTGWSQVNGARGATSTTAQLQRRVDLDLAYIDNWSLGLDLKILVLTCREVLKRTNAY